MQRKVWRDEGDVLEKRFSGVVGFMILEAFQRMIDDRRGCVITALWFPDREIDIVDGIPFGREVVPLILHV